VRGIKRRLDQRSPNMDCSWSDTRLRSISPELLEAIQFGTNADYLQTLAKLALDPKFTITIFTSHEPIFVELCARWLLMELDAMEVLAVVAAFAKILPLAPHLAVFAEECILNRSCPLDAYINDRIEGISLKNPGSSTEPPLLSSLLALYRLLSFDTDTFSPAVSSANMLSLLQHPRRSIRYLAVQVLCLYLQAADTTMEDMTRNLIGSEAINDEWEGKQIDYLFLRLVKLNKIIVAIYLTKLQSLGGKTAQ
jgi:midasin